MVRCATTGSPPNGTAPQGKVAGASEKTPRGGFEGLRIQPCSLWFRERPMPGPSPERGTPELSPKPCRIVSAGAGDGKGGTQGIGTHAMARAGVR